MTMALKDFEIRPATEGDVLLILDFIKKLAVYEKLAHKVTATEDILLPESARSVVSFASTVWTLAALSWALATMLFTAASPPGVRSALKALRISTRYAIKGCIASSLSL